MACPQKTEQFGEVTTHFRNSKATLSTSATLSHLNGSTGCWTVHFLCSGSPLPYLLGGRCIVEERRQSGQCCHCPNMAVFSANMHKISSPEKNIPETKPSLKLSIEEHFVCGCVRPSCLGDETCCI